MGVGECQNERENERERKQIMNCVRTKEGNDAN